MSRSFHRSRFATSASRLKTRRTGLWLAALVATLPLAVPVAVLATGNPGESYVRPAGASPWAAPAAAQSNRGMLPMGVGQHPLALAPAAAAATMAKLEMPKAPVKEQPADDAPPPPPPPTATTTSLAGSQNATTRTVTLTATVVGPATGLVAFCVDVTAYCTGAHLLGEASLTSSGQAVLRVSTGAASHAYTARFLGTTAYSPSISSAVTVTPTWKNTTTTAISSSGTAGNYTLTGAVTGGAPLPTGTVTFKDSSYSNASVGSATLSGRAYSLTAASYVVPPPGYTPTAVASGDLNNDGIPDLLMIDDGGTARAYLGAGDGTFTAGGTVTLSASVGQHSLVLGDFNNDGKLDVVAAGNYNTIAVALGNGDGTFAASTTYSAYSSSTNIQSVAVGDFNHDGNLDFAVGRNPGGVCLYINSGSGTFTSGGCTSVAGTSLGLSVADLDGDGYPDVAAAGGNVGSASILLNNRAGGFATPVQYTGGNFPIDVALTDLDNDGFPDMVVVNRDSAGTVQIFRGSATGAMTAAGTFLVSTGSSSQLNSLAAADFDGDGDIDLGVISDYAMAVVPGNGDNTFGTVIGIPSSGVPRSIAVADFNGDGLPDIADAENYSYRAAVSLGRLTTTATVNGVSVSPTGTHQVFASYPGNTSNAASTSSNVALTGSAPAPTIASVSPSSGTASGGTAVIISGSNFTSDAAVTFGGTSATGLSVVNSTTLTATTPSHTAGVVNVVVTQSSGNATATSAYTYIPGAPGLPGLPLTVTVSPAYIQPGKASTVLRATLTGATYPAPTGGVTFKVDTGITVSGACTTDINSNLSCTATYGTATLSAGTHTITVAFSGDSNYGASSGTGTLTVAAPIAPAAAPSTAVGSVSATQTTSLVMNRAGAITAVQVMTNGALNTEFRLVAGGSCSVGASVANGASCTVNWSFAPATPGGRKGVIVVRSATGILSTTPLTGLGTAPLAHFLSPKSTTLANMQSFSNRAYGMTLDGAGNLYAQGDVGACLQRLTRNGAGYNAPTSYTPAGLSTFFINCNVTSDPAGNLILDAIGTTNSLYLVPWNPVTSTFGTAVNIADVYNNDVDGGGVATDLSGNVFYASTDSGTIARYLRNPDGSNTYQSANVLASNLGTLQTVAVNGQGDVVFTTQQPSGSTTHTLLGILRYNAATDTFAAPVYPYTSADSVYTQQMALDSAGNAYLSGYQLPILQLPYDPAAHTFGTPRTLGASNGLQMLSTGPNTLLAVGYVSSTNIPLTQLALDQPADLAFADTAVGTASAAQTVTLVNDGNAPLSLRSPASGGNPANTPDYQIGGLIVQSGGSAVQLAASGSLAFSVQLKPIATGPRPGTLTFLDNALNVATATQVVTLGGTGITPVLITPTVTVDNRSAYAGSGTTSLTYTVTAGSSTTPFQAVPAITVNGATLTSVCSVPGAVMGQPVPAASITCSANYNLQGVAPGAYTINVSYPGDTNYSTATGSGTLTVQANVTTAPTTAVGSTSAEQTTTMMFAGSGTIGSVALVTNGAVEAEFKSTTTRTCIAGQSYTSATTCTVTWTFNPASPGPRSGFIVIRDTSGTMVSTQPITGIGTGPLAHFLSPKTTQVLSPIKSINGRSFGMALDGVGNLYLQDQNTCLQQLTRNGSQYNAATVFTAAGLPTGHLCNATSDPAGNLVVAVAGTGLYVVPWNAATSTFGTAVRIGDTFDSTGGAVATDPAGNVYYASTDNATIARYRRISAGFDTYGPATNILTFPANTASLSSVAVNGQGDVVFTVTQGTTSSIGILRYDSSADTFAAPVYLPTGTSGALNRSLALDTTGNAFVSDFQKPVLELPYDSAAHAFASPRTLAASNGFLLLRSGPDTLLAVGPDLSIGTILTQYALAQPADRAFPDTAVGSTSAAQTLSLVNDGNTTLTFNPTTAVSSGFAQSGTAPATVAAGQQADTQLTFVPTTAGPTTGTVTFTDNAGNASAAIQIGNLSGNGTAGAPTISFTIGTHTFGDADFTATATSTSAGTITYVVTSGNAFATVDATTGSVHITGAGNVTIRASQAANGAYTAATKDATFTINPAAPTLAFAAIGSKTSGDADFTVSATSASSGAVTYSITAGNAFATVNATTGLVHITGAGTVTIHATQAATANYSTAAADTTFTINPAAPTLAFAAIGAKTFGDPDFTVSATSASSGAVTYSITAGNAFATVNATTGLVHITGAGNVTIHAAQTATASYSAATADTTFTINPAAPTLAFAAIASHTVGEPDFAVSATSASSGAVTYSITAGNAFATVNATTGVVHIVAAGSVTVRAAQAAAGNYAAATADATFTINPAGAPTITFTIGGTHTFGDSDFTVAATSPSSGAFTYTVTSGNAFASVNATSGLVHIVGAGSVTVHAQQAAAGTYTAAGADSSFTIAPKTPSLAFAAIGSKSVGDADFAASATSASSGAVTYSITAGNTFATVNATTGVVHILGAGSVTLHAIQAADANYATATADTTFIINPATTTLTFAPIATHTVGDADFAVSATSTSNGAVTYSITSGNAFATVNATTGVIHILGAGSVTVHAAQAATGNYAAGSADATFTINAGTTTLTFAPIPFKRVGDADFTVAATSSSTGTISYTITAGNGSATIDPVSGLVHIVAAGAVTVRADQAASGSYSATSASTTFTINPANAPTLAFTIGGTHTVGDADFTVAATSNSPGAITYSILSGNAFATVTGSGVVHLIAAGVVTVRASQAASGSYAAATADTTFTANAASSGLALSIADHTVGDADFAIAATSRSNAAITYSITAGNAFATLNGNIIRVVAAGTVTVQASQAASGAYAAATVSTSFNIRPAATSSLALSIPNHTYGDAPFTVTATSSSNGAITYSIVSGPATIAGNIVTLNGAGTVTVQASQVASGSSPAGTAQTSFVVAKAVPVLTWPTPAPITYGTRLGSAQQNATASGIGGTALPGTFAYIPVAGTVVQPPSQILSVTFTPADTANYTTTSASVTLTVRTASLTITADNATRVYGAPDPAFTGTVTGQQNGDVFTETFTTTAATLSPVGTYTIVPAVTGTNASAYTQTVRNGILTIVKANTNTSLTLSTSSPVIGQPITYTVTVASVTTGTPTGTVILSDNGTALGTVTLTNGTGTLTAPGGTVGSHVYTSAYSGDTNFNSSSAGTSVGTPIIVTPPEFNFTVTSLGQSDIKYGSDAVFKFRITPTTGAFYQDVSFTSNGELPIDATAAFSPSVIKAGSGATDLSFTVSTHKLAGNTVPWGTGGLLALALIALPFAAAKRMRRRMNQYGRLLSVAVLLLPSLVAFAGLTGCGSGYFDRSYPVTVTATSAGISHSVKVVVHIQPSPQ